MIDGKIEEDVHYYKRMSGVMYLYFTLIMCYPTGTGGGGNRPQQPATTTTTTTTTGNENGASFEGVRRGWQWLADVMNMKPRANITAEILAIYFKCCGYQMQQAYRGQFDKLVQLCATTYFQQITAIPSEKQSDAAVGRLRAVFDEFRKNRSFAPWKRP